MEFRRYLPSAQFVVLVAALAVSVGIVWAADRVAYPGRGHIAALQAPSGNIETTTSTAWEAQFASSTAFQTSQTLSSMAQNLSAASKTSNLTDSIGRSLLINASAATGEGTIANTPTQQQIVDQALAQIQSDAASTTDAYAQSDVQIVPDSTDAEHAYGNALAAAVQENPLASFDAAMVPVGLAIDNNDPSSLSTLPKIAAAYQALSHSVIALPTPESMRNYTVELANNYAHMAGVIVGMQKVLTDPIRGIAYLQEFRNYNSANANVLVQIAQTFASEGMTFAKDEPGAAWAPFLASIQKAAEQAQASTTQQTQSGSTPPSTSTL